MGPETVDGFAYVTVEPGQTLELAVKLPMRPRLVRASNRVCADAGRVAVMRGPVVYCMESADNDGDLWNYQLDCATLADAWHPELLGGVVQVTADGVRAVSDGADDALYQEAGTVFWEPATLSFVPYYAWANRADGQMRVWVRPTDPRLS